MANVIIPTAYIKPKLPDGQGGVVDNPLFGVALYANLRGIQPEVQNGHTILKNITVLRDFPINPTPGTVSVQEIIGIGGDVEDYPVFIELTDAVYNGQIPEFMPERTYLDEQDNEVIRTWAEYHDDSHTHETIDSKHYIPSNSFGYNLNASVWVQLLSETGTDIKSIEEYQALFPSEDPA